MQQQKSIVVQIKCLYWRDQSYYHETEHPYSHLNKVTCLALVPPRCALNSNVFAESPLTAIYVPNESLEAYLSAPVWSKYADIIQPIP